MLTKSFSRLVFYCALLAALICGTPASAQEYTAIRPLDPNENWLIPIVPKCPRASVKTAELGDDVPTAADMHSAYIKCSPDADLVVTGKEQDTIEIAEGDALVQAKATAVGVAVRNNLVQLQKGAVVLLRVTPESVRVDNLTESHGASVMATFGGQQFKLSAGGELLFGANFNCLQKCGQSDLVQRRRPRLFRFTDGSALLTSEFAPLSLLKGCSLVRDMSRSQRPAERALFNQIVKMSACLTVATASHGGFVEIAPSRRALAGGS